MCEPETSIHVRMPRRLRERLTRRAALTGARPSAYIRRLIEIALGSEDAPAYEVDDKGAS